MRCGMQRLPPTHRQVGTTVIASSPVRSPPLPLERPPERTPPCLSSLATIAAPPPSPASSPLLEPVPLETQKPREWIPGGGNKEHSADRKGPRSLPTVPCSHRESWLWSQSSEPGRIGTDDSGHAQKPRRPDSGSEFRRWGQFWESSATWLTSRVKQAANGAYLWPFHRFGPSLKIWSSVGPTSCSASNQGNGMSGWKGARHSKLPSSCNSIWKSGYGRLVKLLL